MTLPPETGPDDDRFHAGQLVERAAVMEIALRMAFCALIGGRYAAVVAGSQETHWLVENCDAVTRLHQDIPAEQRAALRAALRACRDANHDRNRLVHEAWGTDPGGAPATMRSLQHSYQITGRTWDAEQIRSVANAVADAQLALLAAVEVALGPDSLRAAGQLLAERAAQ